MERHPLHLKNPELQTFPEVEQAVKLQEHRTGEKIPNDPSARIEAYTDRLESIFLNSNEKVRERNLKMLRPKIYDALIIKKENFPESHFELQQRIARERGQAVEDIPNDVREKMIDTAIEEQKHSLDAWIDYLTSDDAVYPAWFKYFVWRNITKLSQFDKERGEFKKRTASTVAPYPDIYREPLAQIADVYEKVKADNKNLQEPEIQQMFSKKFPTLYAELIQKSLAVAQENGENITGTWEKYAQKNRADAGRLFQSLKDKGTGWCTAGQLTAEAQIKNGDFYVYYTNDKNNNPVQPRLAIRMKGKNKIDEVRGVLPHQAVEPIMQSVLDKKLGEFGSEADTYRKKSADMRMLTDIEKRMKARQQLSKDELVFLYEINSPIEGFGYEKDPRVKELRDRRDPKADAPVVFACTPDQIAWSKEEISKSTKAYVGPLFPKVFKQLNNLEHIYTSFPKGKIHRQTIEIGGKTAEQLDAELKKTGFRVTSFAMHLMKSKDFNVQKKTEQTDTIRLRVQDLFDNNSLHTTDDVYEKAKELDLEICPAEVGPHLRLNCKDQSLNEYFIIAMKQISNSTGNPTVFQVGRGEYGGGLDTVPAKPVREWDPGDEFVFSLRK